MTDPDRLVDAYLDGTLPQDELDQLEQALANDPEYADAFAKAMMINQMLGDRFERDAIAKSMQLSTGGFLGQQDLQLLQQDYDNAKPVYDEPGPTPIHLELSDRLTKRQYMDALSYVVKHTFTPKRVAVLAAAAAVLMGVVLGVVLLSGPDDDATIVEGPGQTPAPIAVERPIEAPQVVATLTAERDAVWHRRPGEDLFAGQRLQLIDGFAEVTTARGAVAVIEAPARFELLNDNALRLETGKLVGLCETPTSKGFVVKTVQGDVIDVGTAFGVIVDEDGTVGVRVFTGSVEVSAGPTATEKQPLNEGELARVHSGSVEKVKYDTTLDFQTSMPSREVMPRLTGQVRWLSTPPPSIMHSALADANNAYLFLEKGNALVPAGTKINSSGPLKPIGDKSRAVIGEDTRVDAYILHFDSLEDGGSAHGTIVFDRPIIGVITNHMLLNQSDQHFAHPQVDYPAGHPTRGFENPQVEIGPDGRSLLVSIERAARKSSGDHLRILVAAGDAQP
ncbi:MAG: hypothetical protein AAGB26_04825 [Planctomycetota bacterium]